MSAPQPTRHAPLRLPYHEKINPRRHEKRAQETGIWISGTTHHLKTDIDLPVPLLEKALHMRITELEADNKTA